MCIRGVLSSFLYFQYDLKMSFVTHLECANCGEEYLAEKVHNLCTACHRPLLVNFDLKAIRRTVERDKLVNRPATMWRFLELLPIVNPANIVSLTEGTTPLLEATRLGEQFGLSDLLIKDESRLPTGSFKARGMAMAVTMARELGLERLAAPTAGNAGGALASYAARAGMQAWVFMPEDTPVVNKIESALAGAKVYEVNGLIDDCGKIVAQGEANKGWFNVSTLKEPYRIEGKKTMGLELAEQLEWKLPDAILYPTGGGTGLIGMWKAFLELEALGWLDSEKKPRMFACQSSGCSPIVEAFRKGKRFSERFENAQTVASGLRVPSAVGDFMVLDAVRESGGMAMAAPERVIGKWMRKAASLEGFSLCPETAICLGVLEQLVEEGELGSSDQVVVFNTGASQKYPESVKINLPKIDLDKPILWDKI